VKSPNLDNPDKNGGQFWVNRRLRLSEDGDHVDHEIAHFTPLRQKPECANAEERFTECWGVQASQNRRYTLR